MREETDTAAEPRPGPAAPAPDWDDMLEDMFGLSIRAAHTVKDLFVRPAAVFSAAREADWRGSYTPTFRVFLSLIALLFLLKFFWASDDSIFAESFRTMLEPLWELYPHLPRQEIVEGALSVNWLLYPFCMTFWYLVAALCLVIWGKGTPTTSRVRLFFAAVVPSTTLTIPMTVAVAPLPLNMALPVMFVTLLISPLIDALTTWRGLKPVHAPSRRAWRCALLAVVTLTAGTLSSITAQLGTSVWLSWKIRDELSAPAPVLPDDPLCPSGRCEPPGPDG